MTCDGTGNGRASCNHAARTRHEPAPLELREAPDYTGRKVRVPGGVKLRYDTSPGTTYPLGSTKRARTVLVDHMSFDSQGHPTVVWTASGYWKAVRAEDVELAE